MPLTLDKKARLAWHCRRGMLELDLILHSFLDRGLHRLSTQEIQWFEQLLSHTDPELFAWLMGHQQPTNEGLNQLVTLIRNNS